MNSKSAPKVVQKIAKSGSNFGSTYLKPLELFRRLLGAFLGLPRLSWTALEPQEKLKTDRLSMFLQMPVFWDFEALDVPLGAHSWLLLGRSGSEMVPKMDPTVVQKLIQTMTHKITNN